MKEELKEVDLRFSSQGYKTVGLAVSHHDGPMHFSAIIPMLDPPRADTKLTIFRIREAGINVKMITGGESGAFETPYNYHFLPLVLNSCAPLQLTTNSIQK